MMHAISVQIHSNAPSGELDTSGTRHSFSVYEFKAPLMYASEAIYLDSLVVSLGLHGSSKSSSVPSTCIDGDGDMEVPRRARRAGFPGKSYFYHLASHQVCLAQMT